MIGLKILKDNLVGFTFLIVRFFFRLLLIDHLSTPELPRIMRRRKELLLREE